MKLVILIINVIYATKNSLMVIIEINIRKNVILINLNLQGLCKVILSVMYAPKLINIFAV